MPSLSGQSELAKMDIRSVVWYSLIQFGQCIPKGSGSLIKLLSLAFIYLLKNWLKGTKGR